MKAADDILRSVLDQRQSINAGYSQRAFARDLGLSPQQLSNFLNGKRGLSLELAKKVAAKAKLDEHQTYFFIESLRANFALSKADRIMARARLVELSSRGETKNLEIDLFKTISNWYHLALVELIRISTNNSTTPKFLSKKMGISENEVALALGRLERLELISRTTKGWKVNQDVVTFDQAIPSEAIKNFHRQILEKAINALVFQGSDERYGSSSTIPIKLKNLARAKKMIQEFREKLSLEIADREKGDSIYGLSVQFFNLTPKDTETTL